MKKIQVLFLMFLISCCFMACNSSGGSEYKKMEEKELASEVRQDSLFLGIYLGMDNKDFYEHCWTLNKQGVIREGSGNASISYPITNLKHPTSMEFYPRFKEGKITAMPITFSYASWAPWNKHLYAEHLMAEVKTLLEQWYGEGFIEIENPNPLQSNAWVKVNGNRRISIYYLEESKVKVDIVDLLAEKEHKAS